jgi:choline dehydrogenase-like flavoprotein
MITQPPAAAMQYDAVIVGTGMGGATLGAALARAGRSVLFLELGRDPDPAEAARGVPVESKADRLEDGWKGDTFVPFVGIGTGGSTSLYGMVLERRRSHDFEGWPFGLEELEPWYEAAELLYGVCGSADPLQAGNVAPIAEPSQALSAANGEVFEHLRRRGLHPYRLHLASRRVADCRMCQGHHCVAPAARPCKMDARTTCLVPSLASGNARLITGARVERLTMQGRKVTAVQAVVDGSRVTFEGRIVVLAAGALSTPRILLASGPIGNRSGLVGQRLMRHAIDLFVLTLAPRLQHPVDSKELGMNDFYAEEGGRLGTVQSFGKAPPLEYLRSRPGRNLWKMLGPAAGAVASLVAGAPVVAGILDDRPERENRIELGGTIGRYFYRLPEGDRVRRRALRGKILRAFARYGPVRVVGTSDRPALGHVCGTAMSGSDAATSVVDSWNRAHEVDNLYVVDASFFPTSGGVNPALTIAANALRVADHLTQVL